MNAVCSRSRSLSGGMSKKRGGDFRSVLERLRRADLDKIADRESINPQHETLWRAMQASVDMLAIDEQRRFAELAVFSEDDTVPESSIATLWEHTGRLNDLDAHDLLINLAERSLIQLDTHAVAEGTLPGQSIPKCQTHARASPPYEVLKLRVFADSCWYAILLLAGVFKSLQDFADSSRRSKSLCQQLDLVALGDVAERLAQPVRAHAFPPSTLLLCQVAAAQLGGTIPFQVHECG